MDRRAQLPRLGWLVFGSALVLAACSSDDHPNVLDGGIPDTFSEVDGGARDVQVTPDGGALDGPAADAVPDAMATVDALVDVSMTIDAGPCGNMGLMCCPGGTPCGPMLSCMGGT